MARSDLLISLIKASVGGDTQTVKRAAEAIVAEERAKQHNVLADQLERAIDSMPKANGTLMYKSVSKPIPETTSTRARDFVTEVVPRKKIDDLILPDVTKIAISQLIEEQQRGDVLRSHALEPRHRVLLIGPPGNGKTSLAEALAEILGVSLFVVRYETMIGSFLGETASRMKHVFDYARTTPCVLFFDEFDAVGKERGDKHETGEIKRVVTSLLMQIDSLPSYVVVVAASNHAELLDRAVWRRFQLRLELPRPSQKQLSQFLDTLLKKSDIKFGVTSSQIVKTLGDISYSEAEDFFLDVIRRQLLAMGEKSLESIVREQLKLWAARVNNYSEDSK